jgi:hypothetical protein
MIEHALSSDPSVCALADARVVGLGPISSTARRIIGRLKLHTPIARVRPRSRSDISASLWSNTAVGAPNWFENWLQDNVEKGIKAPATR